MRDVGKNIRSRRAAAGLTQDELAERVHVSRQTVSNYETGFSRPDVEMLALLAEALDTDVNTLIYGETLNEETEEARRERRGNLGRLVAAVVCLAALIGGYCYLLPIANRFASRSYSALPSAALGYLWLPLLLLLAGWTVCQLLGTFFGLKRVSAGWGRWVRRGLLAALGLFLLLPLPFWVESCLELRAQLTALAARQLWSSQEYWAGVPVLRTGLYEFGRSVVLAVWGYGDRPLVYGAFVLLGGLLWLTGGGFVGSHKKHTNQIGEI